MNEVWVIRFDGKSMAVDTFEDVLLALADDFEWHQPDDGPITLDVLHVSDDILKEMPREAPWS